MDNKQNLEIEKLTQIKEAYDRLCDISNQKNAALDSYSYINYAEIMIDEINNLYNSIENKESYITIHNIEKVLYIKNNELVSVKSAANVLSKKNNNINEKALKNYMYKFQSQIKIDLGNLFEEIRKLK